MHRLLVLSGLAAAIVTIPGLATAGNPAFPDTVINATHATHGGARVSDYWTVARMAAASALPTRRVDGDGTAQLRLTDAG
jgi:hypothetical protein